MSSYPAFYAILKWFYAVFNVGFIVLIYFALRGSGFLWPVRVGLCLFAVVLSLAFPVSQGLGENSIWIKELSFVGYYWCAFIYHIFLAWIVLGVFRLINWRFRWLVIAEENRVLWRRWSYAGIVAVALSVCVGGWINSQYPVVREAKLPVSPGIAPLRIVALSDLHLGRMASNDFLSNVVNLIEPLSPDIVVFLGDFLEWDFDPSRAPAAAAVLQRLKPRLGIWGAMGNHEFFGARGKRNRDLLNQIGIRTLDDQWVMIGEKPSEKILLIGRRDYSWGRKPIEKVIANVPEKDKDVLKILLDHQPVDLEGAKKAGVFLQLSGHSHNGQFFPINFLVPFLFENAYGYYRRGQTHYWVTSGVGALGPRIRTTGRPEIMLIDLVPQPAWEPALWQVHSQNPAPQ